MTAGLGALGDDQVDARVYLLDRVLLGADEGRDRDSALLSRLDHVVRRHPEGIGHQFDRMTQRDLQQTLAGVAGQRGGGDADLLDRDVVIGQQLGDEVPVVRRNTIGQLRLGQVLALAFELGRHDDVHAVGLAVDVLIDPAQLLFELIRRECHPAEHTEPARIGDRGDHVTTVAEGEQWKVDAVLLTDLRFHEPIMRCRRRGLMAGVRPH